MEEKSCVRSGKKKSIDNEKEFTAFNPTGVKKRIIIVLLILLTTFTSLAQNIESEADEEFLKFKNKHFETLDGDKFSQESSSGLTLHHYKNLTLSLVNNKLSHIEVLNGMEYKGVITIKADAHRFIYTGSGYETIWYEWTELKTMEIRVIKKRGTWRFPQNQSGSWDRSILLGNSKPEVNRLIQLLKFPMRDSNY